MTKKITLTLIASSALFLAACEQGGSTGPVTDPAADDLGEALNEPTDGAENETSVE